METKKNIGEAKIVGQPKAPFRFKLKDGCVKSNHLAEESVATDNIQNAAVSTEKIMDEAVTNAKIMNGAITNSKISNGTITNEKIANNSIDNSKIQNLTLTGDKFTDNSIDGSKIKDNSVPGSKLADGAIESIDLQDNTLSGSKLADNSVDGDKLVDGAVTSEKLKDNSIDGSKIADGTIQSLDIKDGSISGSKLVDNSISGIKLSDGIITNNKIADNSITGDKFLDESISGEKIQANTIHGSKLETGTVDGADIIEGTLNGNKIADMSVDGDKLADDSIETRHIKSNTISGSKIVTNSIDSTKIRNNSLIGENIATGTLTGDKFVDNTITGDKIIDNTLPGSKIKDGTIENVDIKDNTLSGAKLIDNSISGSKIADNAITSAHLLDNSIPASKILDGTIESIDIKDGTLDGSKVKDSTITGAKLADNVVTTAKLLNGSITTDKINNLAVTESKIATNAVTENKIGTGAVTNTKIFDGSVTEGKIGSSAVTNAKIADSAVTEDKLADGAVTMAKLADDTISKMETITDVTPTEGSVKPIQSGGVQEALLDRAIVGDIVGDPAEEWVPGTAEAYIDQRINEQNNLVNTRMNRQDTVINAMNGTVQSIQQAVELLNGSDVIVVADHTQVVTPDSQKIYREQGTTTYTDWMYQGGAWKEIATYSFPGIDDEPTAGSENLVKSGGVKTSTDNSINDKLNANLGNGITAFNIVFTDTTKEHSSTLDKIPVFISKGTSFTIGIENTTGSTTDVNNTVIFAYNQSGSAQIGGITIDGNVQSFTATENISYIGVYIRKQQTPYNVLVTIKQQGFKDVVSYINSDNPNINKSGITDYVEKVNEFGNLVFVGKGNSGVPKYIRFKPGHVYRIELPSTFWNSSEVTSGGSAIFAVFDGNTDIIHVEKRNESLLENNYTFVATEEYRDYYTITIRANVGVKVRLLITDVSSIFASGEYVVNTKIANNLFNDGLVTQNAMKASIELSNITWMLWGLCNNKGTIKWSEDTQKTIAVPNSYNYKHYFDYTKVKAGDIFKIYATSGKSSGYNDIIGVLFTEPPVSVDMDGEEIYRKGTNNLSPISGDIIRIPKNGYLAIYRFVDSSNITSFAIAKKRDIDTLINLSKYRKENVTYSATSGKGIDSAPNSVTFGSPISIGTAIYSCTDYIDLTGAQYIQFHIDYTNSDAFANTFRTKSFGHVFYDANKEPLNIPENNTIQVCKTASVSSHALYSGGDFDFNILLKVPEEAKYIRHTFYNRSINFYSSLYKQTIDDYLVEKEISDSILKQFGRFVFEGDNNNFITHQMKLLKGHRYILSLLDVSWKTDNVASGNNILILGYRVNQVSTNIITVNTYQKAKLRTAYSFYALDNEYYYISLKADIGEIVNVNLTDITDITQLTSVTLPYTGEVIIPKKTCKLNLLTPLFTSVSLSKTSCQGMCIYSGKYLFASSMRDDWGDNLLHCHIVVRDLDDFSLKGVVEINGTPLPGSYFHMNCLTHGILREGFTYPPIYISECTGNHMCEVVQISNDATSYETIQRIKLDSTLNSYFIPEGCSFNYDYIIDAENSLLYVLGGSSDTQHTKINMLKFNLPQISYDGVTPATIELTESDVLQRYDAFDDYDYAGQGGTVIGDKLYCPRDSHTRGIFRVFDLKNGNKISEIDLNYSIGEPEDVSYYKDNMLAINNGSYLYTMEF